MSGPHFEYNKLRGKIVEKYGSQKEFAKALGISENSFSLKMNCKSGFSQADMDACGKLLDIPVEEFGSYFFA